MKIPYIVEFVFAVTQMYKSVGVKIILNHRIQLMKFLVRIGYYYNFHNFYPFSRANQIRLLLPTRLL